MKWSPRFLLAALAAAAALAPCTAVAEDVLTLTDKTFDAAFPNQGLFVEFIAPWCGHCKKLAPVFEKVASEFKEAKSPVIFAKVDATAEDSAELAKKFNIESFPQLKLFLPGSTPKDAPLAFEGDREDDVITKWINRKLSPPAKDITTQEGMDEAIAMIRAPETPDGLPNKNLDAISGIIGLFSDPSQLVAFEKAASEDVDKHHYGKVTVQPLLGALEAKYSVKAPVALVFRQWDEAPRVIADAAVLADKAKFLDAVQVNTEPPSDVVTIASEEDFKAAVKSSVPYVVEFYAPWCSYCKEFAPHYEKVAGKYLARDKVVIAKIDATKFEDVASDQRIEMFPTVKMYKAGMSVFFKGNLLDRDDVVTPWIESKLNAKVETLEESKVEDTIKVLPQVLIAKAGGTAVKEFLTFLDRVVFTAPSDLGVYFVNSNVGGSSVTLYRDGKLVSKYPGTITDGDAFEEWRQRALIPFAWRFNDDTFEAVQAGKLKGVVFLLAPKPLPPPASKPKENMTEEELADFEEASETKVEDSPLVKVMTQVGASGKFPDVTFSFGEVKDDAYLLEFFNVKEADTPCIRILDMTNPKKSVSYAVDATPKSLESPETYETAIKQWMEGKLKVIERPAGEEDEDEEEDNKAAAAAEKGGEEAEEDHEGHDHGDDGEDEAEEEEDDEDYEDGDDDEEDEEDEHDEL